MKLTWYGHSCFMLESEAGTVVFDPYAPGSVPGVELPELKADMVISSHGHSDHYYPQGVKLTGNETALKIERMDTFHDDTEGKARGGNTVTLIEAEGLRVVHLGDLGHMLSREQLEMLGRVDVLMIPVGGFYTIDAETAGKLAEAVKPSVVIPMHYRGKGFGFDNIAPVDDFLQFAEKVVRADSNVLELNHVEQPLTVVLKCPVRG